jgi:alginate O-acetyltransferase complex protein AlgI
MVFSSAIFLFVFLPAFLIASIVTSRLGTYVRNLNIAIFSLAFYVFGGGFYTLILIGSILFNWAYGRFVVAKVKSSWLLALGVAVNLIPLLVFKYLDFLFAITTQYLFKPFLHTDLPVLHLFLPAGISFYTFQAISYLIDVHRRQTDPEKNLTTFAAYKLFFPQLVAGPIVRYVEVKENFHKARMTLDGLNAGIFFFGVGLAKKMLIADPIGHQVDIIYAMAPEQISNFMAWFAAIGYFLQIFFDFSGYSEMAIGMGLMAGFSFPENFRQPYRAHSITDFWRRWHMTLSRWFRDYLYIPLGGNKGGLARTLINLWVVFLLCGLWHGAALTFVAWGAYHGALLVIERVLKKTLKFEPRHIPGVAITTLLVIIGWVLFRSRTFDQAGVMLAKMAFIDRAGQAAFEPSYYLTPYMITLFAVGLVFSWLPMETWRMRERMTGYLAVAGALAGTLLCIASVAMLAAKGFNPFIYFQF